MNTYTVVYRDQYNGASMCVITAADEQSAREEFKNQFGDLPIDFINLNPEE